MHRLFLGNLSRAVSRQLSATPFVLHCPSLVPQVMIQSRFLLLFFFKQKTAYEITVCWSSDVCSSDLADARISAPTLVAASSPPMTRKTRAAERSSDNDRDSQSCACSSGPTASPEGTCNAGASAPVSPDRKSVV